MKKGFIVSLFLFCFVICHAQTNITVNVHEDIYTILNNAYERGLCSPLPGAKPYTEKKILSIIEEILKNDSKLSETEIKILTDYQENCKRSSSNNFKILDTLFFENNDWTSVPLTFQINYGLETNVSGGVYNTSEYNSYGFDLMPKFGFSGDIGNNFGYNIQALIDVSEMPLINNGEYDVGLNWFSYVDSNGKKVPARSKTRKITSYSNTNYLPFSYLKPWGGQFYYLSNMSASGLEGWAHELGFTGNIFAELHTSFLNDKVNIGLGRNYREWAAMDKNSSLVLNGTAMPFFGLDITVELLPYLTYSSLTGTLEYPNRDDIFGESLPGNDDDDASLWQNAFSLNMVEFNLNGFHVDFGSSVIWPKRFELGYMFPLTNYVEYQNHIGDYDNLALFGDLKYTKVGIGSVWGSVYLDEINGLNNNPIKYTRAMFATQAGIKAVLPSIPFGSIVMRYTKVEPYCYTHHSVNYLPYYDDYVCMNYTNNGINLGSYLPPNSDELLFRFDAMPNANLITSLSFQMIRHGADYGSQQVRGSSIYSELDNSSRDDLTKNFLHDGAYNWIHILSLNASYSNRQYKIPVKFNITLGGVVSYYTAISDSEYRGPNDWYAGESGNYGNCSGDYSIIDTDEYPFTYGAVLSIGVTIGHF